MKNLYSLVFLLFCVSFSFAQTSQNIQLPNPQKTGGMPLMQALQNRKSERNFDASKNLTNQQISNLLWAAYGFNRPGKRTAPSSMDSQEFSLYVFLKTGIYVWDSQKNILQLVAAGDLRALAGKQDFVKDASVNIVYVADYSKLTKVPTDAEKDNTAAVNCGFIAQNVNLYCASENLGCVVRGYIDKQEISKKLQLPTTKKVILAQSVGYVKTK